MKRVIAGLMFVHRYLGLAFCLIFVIWFASGIVMVYKRMPEYCAEERLARMPALDAAGIRVTPAQALEVAGFGEAPRRVLLTSFQGAAGLPVLRRLRFVHRVSPTTAALSMSWTVRLRWPLLRRQFPESRGTVRYLDGLEQPDQWTINNRFGNSGVLHHIGLGDGAGTELYVSEATGEIVQKTDRSSRFWGYLGPVMHWFYFTPLRAQRGPLWNNLVVYGSVVGLLPVHPRDRHRRLPLLRLTPVHAGHLDESVCGLAAVAPLCRPAVWRLHVHMDVQRPADDDAVQLVRPGRARPAQQVRAIRGDGVDLAAFNVPPGAAIAEFQKRFQPKEVELLQFMGEPFYAAYERADLVARAHQDTARYVAPGATLARVLVTASGDTPRVKEGFTQDELVAAARAAMPGFTTSSRIEIRSSKCSSKEKLSSALSLSTKSSSEEAPDRTSSFW